MFGHSHLWFDEWQLWKTKFPVKKLHQKHLLRSWLKKLTVVRVMFSPLKKQYGRHETLETKYQNQQYMGQNVCLFCLKTIWLPRNTLDQVQNSAAHQFNFQCFPTKTTCLLWCLNIMYKMDFTSVRHAGFSAKTAILALPANNRVKNETDKLIMELIFFL